MQAFTKSLSVHGDPNNSLPMDSCCRYDAICVAACGSIKTLALCGSILQRSNVFSMIINIIIPTHFHNHHQEGKPPLSSHTPRGPIQSYHWLGGCQTSHVWIPLEGQWDQGSSAFPQDGPLRDEPGHGRHQLPDVDTGLLTAVPAVGTVQHRWWLQFVVKILTLSLYIMNFITFNKAT